MSNRNRQTKRTKQNLFILNLLQEIRESLATLEAIFPGHASCFSIVFGNRECKVHCNRAAQNTSQKL